jgi:hypothetical protein
MGKTSDPLRIWQSFDPFSCRREPALQDAIVPPVENQRVSEDDKHAACTAITRLPFEAVG